MTGRVRWRETVEWFGANGVTTLYEIGAGKVLSGLARRINRDIATAASARRPMSRRRWRLAERRLYPEASQPSEICHGQLGSAGVSICHCLERSPW